MKRSDKICVIGREVRVEIETGIIHQDRREKEVSPLGPAYS